MSIFSKLFGSKKFEDYKTENNGTLSQDAEVFNNPITQVVEFKNTHSIVKSLKVDDNPETLPEAIRYMVGKWGKDYLMNRGFVNVLNDFKVLKDIPAAKHILLNMQSEGYISKMLSSANWEIDAPSYIIQFAKNYGTRNDIVSYVVQSIGYGLKFTSIVPIFKEDDSQRATIDTSPQNTQPTPVLESTEPYDPKRDLEYYRYPTLDLLKKYDNDRPYIDMAEQNANKNRIVELFRNYGIELSSIKTTVGPTMTLCEITLAPGVLISKVRKIADDFCLIFGQGTQIIAPIPGKGTIGIEFPNAMPSIVSMESIINSRKYQESYFELPCAIGKTVTNEVFMLDLTKAPHLLIAGATGQGKSVCLNVIITSLLYKKHPAELKLVLVDPKKIEFSIYSPLTNHFLAQVPSAASDPIISSASDTVRTLNSLCKLMDTRFDLLKEVAVRNIREYNKKFVERRIPPRNGHGYMPYIVVVMDEYGDLMMTAGKEMELPILRLSQMAHIVGIHMIIATRRFSSQILTENLKANFLTRIAFRTSSMTDSKMIIDRPGAQQLMGRGDMLYQTYGGEPLRIQGANVDTSEVDNISRFIEKQDSYRFPFELPEPDVPEFEDVDNDVDLKHLDPLFEDAARIVVFNQIAGTSQIQRKFAIGYNRAGRLMDQLEKAGIIGMAKGSAPRDVIIKDETSLNKLLNKLR